MNLPSLASFLMMPFFLSLEGWLTRVHRERERKREGKMRKDVGHGYKVKNNPV
jgi:hypothetical protein